ncbi:hypothetical protein COO60DRAFT_128168 [Scenedesmus sp. NREL 46B-D3]|nr:hypothetical protein COO60DRAFT_128168 [Scenedesmus sp. NREL 46B-D3]
MATGGAPGPESALGQLQLSAGQRGVAEAGVRAAQPAGGSSVEGSPLAVAHAGQAVSGGAADTGELQGGGTAEGGCGAAEEAAGAAGGASVAAPTTTPADGPAAAANCVGGANGVGAAAAAGPEAPPPTTTSQQRGYSCEAGSSSSWAAASAARPGCLQTSCSTGLTKQVFTAGGHCKYCCLVHTKGYPIVSGLHDISLRWLAPRLCDGLCGYTAI